MSDPNFTPLGDRVLVDPLKEEEVTAGGVVLPDNVRERPQRGIVVAFGPGSRSINGTVLPLDLNVGDEVAFSRYGGSEIKIGADDFLILREVDILGVFR